MIPDGIAGYIVPLDDPDALARKIETLVIDTALREDLGREARRWVIQEFSLQKMASRMGQVYREVLAAKKP